METQIIEAAIALGAVRAGIARLDTLLNSPSHVAEPPVQWNQRTGSILILALAHPPTQPHLDWWDGNRGTPGNRKLMEITRALEQRLKEDYDIIAHDLPYHVEKGGLFLKDAAVIGGLGVIGKNNLLLTPDLGPGVRFRAMFLNRILDSTGPLDVAFCDECPMPCMQRCPQNAFKKGVYSRAACQRQMQLDIQNRSERSDPEAPPDHRAVIKYCRICELSCPVGKA